ncbi:MAG: asparagine synthase [bacterium]|nr:asparagine synthase [bacterium]
MTHHSKKASRLETLLGAAVLGRKAQYDQPALFLSGGLDSAILQAIGEFDHLYCVSWPEEDNSAAARRAAGFLSPEMHTVTFTREEMLAELPAIASYCGPDGTWSQVCQWFAAKQAAKDGCDACFTGEGADEYFGGYARYKILHWLQRLQGDPKLEEYLPLVGKLIGPREKLLSALYGDAFEDVGDWHLVTAAAEYERQTTLPALLELETAMIEAHGMTAVYPFMDDSVRWFAEQLEPEDLVTDDETKHVLRDVARLIVVHEDIIDEKTKKGLFIPQSWRPDGEPLWSRDWFTKLMREAYAGAGSSPEIDDMHSRRPPIRYTEEARSGTT